MPIDSHAGVHVGPVDSRFVADGKRAGIRRNSATGLGRTDLTRVSAVLVVEELVVASGAETGEIGLAMTVAHSPFATSPIPPAFFGSARQLVDGADGMRWRSSAGAAGDAGRDGS